MTMKDFAMKISFLLVIFSFFAVSNSFAQHHPPKKHHPPGKKHAPAKKHVKKKKTAMFLNKTNKVIKHADKKVKEGKVYTGALTKAVGHQKAAIKHFNKGEFKKAMGLSYKARKLAFHAIKANKGKVEPNWEVSDEDKAEMDTVPSDEELEGELTEEDKKGEEGISVEELGNIEIQAE